VFPELCRSFLVSSSPFGPGGIDICDIAKPLKSRLIAKRAIYHLAGTDLNAKFSARVLRFVQCEPPQNGDCFFFGQSGRFHLQRHPFCWTKSADKKLQRLYRKITRRGYRACDGWLRLIGFGSRICWKQRRAQGRSGTREPRLDRGNSDAESLCDLSRRIPSCLPKLDDFP
jgi:hypothetical protein